jgi:hypothetical protein
VREFIGVRAETEFLKYPSLKREVMLYDRIALTDIKTAIGYIMQAEEQGQEFIQDIHWLNEQGIVFEVSDWAESKGMEGNKSFAATIEQFDQLRPKINKLAQSYLERIEFAQVHGFSGPRVTTKLLDEYLKQSRKLFDLSARLAAIRLRHVNKLDAYPVCNEFVSLDENNTSKSEVVQIIITALPIPDQSIPWEQVVEYRSDPDSRSKFLALRHWMSEVARAELTPAEVEEKLEYLLDQYQKHMRLHRMKTNVGTLETVVTTGAEFLGDMVSFKWGKAAEALFSLKRRQVALLEGELTAPGSEVAYIVKARDTFGNE